MPSQIETRAKQLGFLAIGFARPVTPLFFEAFRKWIRDQKFGEMVWLARHMDLREQPRKLLQGAQTVISLAYPYSSSKPMTTDGFCTARYAEPGKADYHERVRALAASLAVDLHKRYPGSRTRICVDSAPILERSLAYASGIGFIGKNNSLILPGYGSYFFLAEILTTAYLHFPEKAPPASQCGSCNRCLDACPTGALERPFAFDASRCLSYLTIEYKGEIDGGTGRRMANCLFGCDVCQEICPFNEVDGTEGLSLPSSDKILMMDEKRFKEVYGRTALARAGLEKIRRNIRAIRSSGSDKGACRPE
jgi:epoxyqueuosine reductase